MPNKRNVQDYTNASYNDFLELLKIEFGEFLKWSEAGRNVRLSGLRSRQASIRLRNLLKQYRSVSLKQEKFITEVIKNAKKHITEESLK